METKGLSNAQFAKWMKSRRDRTEVQCDQCGLIAHASEPTESWLCLDCVRGGSPAYLKTQLTGEEPAARLRPKGIPRAPWAEVGVENLLNMKEMAMPLETTFVSGGRYLHDGGRFLFELSADVWSALHVPIERQQLGRTATKPLGCGEAWLEGDERPRPSVHFNIRSDVQDVAGIKWAEATNSFAASRTPTKSVFCLRLDSLRLCHAKYQLDDLLSMVISNPSLVINSGTIPVTYLGVFLIYPDHSIHAKTGRWDEVREEVEKVGAKVVVRWKLGGGGTRPLGSRAFDLRVH